MAHRPKQRRSLSTTRSRARAEWRGSRTEGELLAAALQIGPAEQKVAHSLTHGFHGYPARMHPATARALVQMALEARTSRKRPLVLLDPFCGSGTVLVEARWAGARGRGVDANPLAILIARARTAAGRPEQQRDVRGRAHAIASQVIEAGKLARYGGAARGRERVPRGIDVQKRQRQLAHWFAPHVRRELEALASGIEGERKRVADILTAALSSILYKVSKRESDTVDHKVERSVARGAAARLFAQRADQLVDGLTALASVSGPNVGIARGDARHLAKVDIAPGNADAIVTSPPYPGTYDYLAHQKLRYAFLGLGAGKFSHDEIGSRRSFRGDAATLRAATERWRRDFRATLDEMARALKRGGTAAIVIGDSVAGSRAMYADRALEELAPDAFELVAIASQPRPTFTAAEHRAFAGSTKREHIVVLRKR